MDVEYFYCDSCGFEGHDLYVGYSRQTASGELCYCPECNVESSNFTKEEL